MSQNYPKIPIPSAFISEEDLTTVRSTVQRSESVPFIPTISYSTPSRRSPRRKKSTPQPKRSNSLSTKRKKVVFPSKSLPGRSEARRKSSTLSVEQHPSQQDRRALGEETKDTARQRKSPDSNDADASSLSGSPKLTFFRGFTNFSSPYLSAASTRKASYATAESFNSVVSPPSPILGLHRASTTSSDAGRTLPPLSLWTGSNTSSSSLLNSPLSPKLTTSSPNSPKAALADAVTTRVSVSPSKIGSVIRIVESNGDHDAFWDAHDDLTTIDPAQDQKNGPGGVRKSSLDAVTAKLTWWSWGGFQDLKSVPSDPQNPRHPATHPSIDNTDVPSLAVPPNSLRTSQHSSRFPSEHHSQHPSTNDVYEADDDSDEGLSCAKGKTQPLATVSQWSRRKESDSTSSEDTYRPRLLDEVRFSFHRDSVCLARDRLFQTEGIQPERFARKDSVAVAKARLAAKPKFAHPPHMEAVSETQAVHVFPRSGGGGSEAEAQDEQGGPRHIRIVDPHRPMH